MPDLPRLRSDLAAFASVIGCPLAEWQDAPLALERRTTVIVAQRQTGTSRALAVLALHLAFKRAAQRVLPLDTTFAPMGSPSVPRDRHAQVKARRR